MITARRRSAQGGAVVKFAENKRTFVAKDALTLSESFEYELQRDSVMPVGTRHQTVQSFYSSLGLAQANEIYQTTNNRKRWNESLTMSVEKALLLVLLFVPTITTIRGERRFGRRIWYHT